MRFYGLARLQAATHTLLAGYSKNSPRIALPGEGVMKLPFLFVVAIALAAAGCQTSLLYDPARDEQGKAAVKSVEEAHLTATVESLGTAFADMAAKEEANARAYAEQVFDWGIDSIGKAASLDADPPKPAAGQPARPKGLLTNGINRLKELGLQDVSPTGLQNLIIGDAGRRADLEALQLKRITFLGAFGIAFSNCVDVVGASADPASADPAVADDDPSARTLKRIRLAQQADARAHFKELVDDCKALETNAAAFQALFAGGTVNERLDEITKGVNAAKAFAVEKAKIARDIATAKADAASAFRAAEAGKAKLAAVEAEANELLDKIAIARTVNELAGAEVLAEEKLEWLEAILASVAGTPADGKVKLEDDELLGVAIIRGLPALRDDAKALLADAAKPRLTPIVAAIDYQELLLAKLEAVHEVDRKRMALAEEQLNAEFDEAIAWAQVLQRIRTDAGWARQSIMALDGSLSGQEKGTFYEALAIYGDSVREARIEQAVLEARFVATQYERGLINSRYAAAQWDALLDTTAKILSEYHAAGIKTEDVAEFFKALGLVTIGVGAAQ
jgi:hypothetical protein